MRYKRPSDAACADILDDAEYSYLLAMREHYEPDDDDDSKAARQAYEAATVRVLNRAARRKAWRAHKEGGACGQLQSLTMDHCIGASVLLRGYTRSNQVTPIAAHVSRLTTARFSLKLERHDLSGEPTGVRVTLVGFGAPPDSSRERE